MRSLPIVVAMATLTACYLPSTVPPPVVPSNVLDCFAELGAAGGGEREGQSFDEPQGDYSGTWAQMIVRTSVASPPVGSEVTSTVTTLLRVELAQDGTSLEMTSQVCDVDIQNEPESTRTVLSDSFVEGLPVITNSAVISAVGGVDVFFLPRVVEVRGVELQDPESDPLPTDPEDPRVRDQDGDGHPGMTFSVFGFVDGEMYVVQRLQTTMCGSSSDDRHLDGSLQWGLEQVVLDASNFFLDRQTPTRVHEEVDRHYFRSTRVEADVGCEEIVARSGELFGR